MSTRYMKKVYGGDVTLEAGHDDTSDTEVSVISNKSKSFNVFDMLNQDSDKDEGTDDEQKDEDLNANNENYNDTKRRKKKKKHKKLENERVKSQQEYDAKCDNNVDEIERSVREVNKLLGEPLPGCSCEVQEAEVVDGISKENMLTTQRKHLNPYNELKRIFGSKTIEAEQSKKSKGRSGNLKKTQLISPQDNWAPIIKSGLSMTHDYSMKTTDNVQYFVYQHSTSYKKLQLEFLQAVESLNPEGIINILNANFYHHIDSLLQLSEICKMNEDFACAAEFIEIALYCLECAFHSGFNVTTAQCRLDYRKQQNRALFITIFKHLGFVGGRACYRTSLEFCKLLLSLDPEGDPLAVVLCIDFYAVKAKEYEWFIKFCNLWEESRNLTQLPNIAYSLALAHFRLGNKTDADTLLQRALIKFPGALMPLLKKCNIQTDSKVMNHEFFSKTQAGTSLALEKLQKLYIARSFHLWKEADILPWLEECVHAVLNLVDSKDDYIKYCRVKRNKRYRGKLPRNILRHIILSDLQEVIVNVQEIQGEEMLSYDPLPPLDSIDIYKKIPANDRPAERNSNLFSLFFSSLFTDINGAAAAVLNELNLFEENDDHA